jgi:hypothetical protein
MDEATILPSSSEESPPAVSALAQREIKRGKKLRSLRE